MHQQYCANMIVHPDHKFILPPMAVQYTSHRTYRWSHVIWYCTAIGGSSIHKIWTYLLLQIISIKNEKLSNSNNIITAVANLSFLGSSGISSFSDRLCICWIWSALYLLFYKKIICLEFRTNLTFYINFSRQEHQIDVLYVLFNTWDFQDLLYTPFHFSFTVPLMQKKKIKKVNVVVFNKQLFLFVKRLKINCYRN